MNWLKWMKQTHYNFILLNLFSVINNNEQYKNEQYKNEQ